MTESDRERHWRQLYAAELEVSDRLREQLRVAEEIRDAARSASARDLEARRVACDQAKLACFDCRELNR